MASHLSNEAAKDRKRLEDDALYFSRRAREERQAYALGQSRKCRQAHLELADAYEFRANLLTREMRRSTLNDAQPSRT